MVPVQPRLVVPILESQDFNPLIQSLFALVSEIVTESLLRTHSLQPVLEHALSGTFQIQELQLLSFWHIRPQSSQEGTFAKVLINPELIMRPYQGVHFWGAGAVLPPQASDAPKNSM